MKFGPVFLKRACLATQTPVFTPHALRRAAVDSFLRAGVDVGTASTYFGHSPEVMLRHYRQATLEDQRRAMMVSGLGKLTQADVLEFPKSG